MNSSNFTSGFYRTSFSLKTISENEEFIFSNVNTSFTNKQKIRAFFSNLWSKLNSTLYGVFSANNISKEQSQQDEETVSIARIARNCNPFENRKIIKEIVTPNLTINFIVHIYENMPSSISFTFERPVTLRRFKKEVDRVLKIKGFWYNSVIMWHTRVFERDIRLGDNKTDRMILRYLMKNNKLKIIDNDALFETLQSWNNLVEVTIMKKSKLSCAL